MTSVIVVLNINPCKYGNGTVSNIKFFSEDEKSKAKEYYEKTLEEDPCPSMIFKTPIPYKHQGRAEIIEHYGFRFYKDVMKNLIFTLERLASEVYQRFKVDLGYSSSGGGGGGNNGRELFFILQEDIHAYNFSDNVDKTKKIFEEIAVNSGAACLMHMYVEDVPHGSQGRKFLNIKIIGSSGWIDVKRMFVMFSEVVTVFIKKGYFVYGK